MSPINTRCQWNVFEIIAERWYVRLCKRKATHGQFCWQHHDKDRDK